MGQLMAKRSDDDLPPEQADLLTLKRLKAFMRINPSLEDTANYFDTTTRAIQRFLEAQGTTFVAFREQNMVKTRRALIRKALDLAINKGNTAMLIFCLKNLCDWRDRPPQEDFESLFSKMTRQELINFLKAKFPELEEKVVMQAQAPKQIEDDK